MRVPNSMQRSSVGINMTPLIDVVFQLLIFFLVSSHLSKQEAQMALPLPTAESGYEQESDDSPRVTLNVLADGQLVLAGRHITVEELPGRLQQLASASGAEIEVRVRSDRNVEYRRVEPLLLACARSGIKNVTFAVHRASDVGPSTR